MSLDQTLAVDLATLHDHYKDTFAHIKEWERRRDRAFFAVAALIGFLFLGVNYPATVKAVFTEATLANAKFDPTKLPVGILLSVGWSVLFALVLRHCQASITIERQYHYLHALEGKLAAVTGDEGLFQREGLGYLSEYPAFSTWAYLFYAAVFPLTVVVVSTMLLVFESASNYGLFHPIYDAVMGLGIVVSFFLYRLWPLVVKKCVKDKKGTPRERKRVLPDR